MGSNEVIDGFACHVHGVFSDAVHIIETISQELHLRAFDTKYGEFWDKEKF